MTTITTWDDKGNSHEQVRDDAVRHNGRYTVPTSDATKWVGDWDEFRAAGGQVCFGEDQTEIELKLPAPYKFSIRFQRP